jgi:hypothetical protein
VSLIVLALVIALAALGMVAVTIGRVRRVIDTVFTSVAALRTEQQRALAVVRVEAQRSARLRRD